MNPELHWTAVLANTCSVSAATPQYNLVASVGPMSIGEIEPEDEVTFEDGGSMSSIKLRCS